MQGIAAQGLKKQRYFAPLLFVFLSLAVPASAQNYFREELRIPFAQAGAKGLQVILIRPNAAGRYPLAIISHGSPRNAAERMKMTPHSLLPQATEFARRGWAVAIVMRRGYGNSGGAYAESTVCNSADYVTSGRNGAADIRTAILFLMQRPDIDPSRIIAVGQSAGGFSSIALSEDPPRGLIAVINFAGGRGSRKPDEVCSPERLIEAFGVFGKRSRVPTLWVYTQNDRFFDAKLAARFHEAFVKAGGNADFTMHPAFDEDGHRLFSRGVALWTPIVDEFLHKNKLTLRNELLPLPKSDLAPPRGLSERGRAEFEKYLAAAPNKAFAVSPQGQFGWRSGRGTEDDARNGALENCRKHSSECAIYAINDKLKK